MDLYSHLKTRGVVAQVNDEEAFMTLLREGAIDSAGHRRAIYCGFDPTAKSLTIGHLVPILNLRRAQEYGFTPIILFGGATGLIGDPTGRSDMRPMSTKEQIQGYIANFAKLISRYFRTDVPNAPVFVNNIDWIGPMSWLDFARDVGVHFTVAKLLSAEVNRSRLEQGLTFMEMGYQLLQSFDFLHLFKTFQCVIQTGGNDQWSNMLGGSDLIRRVEGARAFCFTAPLLVDKNGQKIGKSAGNAVWLDPEMTSPYELFQFVRNIPDEALENTYRLLTLCSEEVIRARCATECNINETKGHLAFEITRIVHGEEEATKAKAAAEALFGGQGSIESAPERFIGEQDLAAGPDIVSVLAKSEICASKGEARRLLQGGGLYLNGERIADPEYVVSRALFASSNNALLVRKGKKEYFVLRLN